jgi:hypothetical protein
MPRGPARVSPDADVISQVFSAYATSLRELACTVSVEFPPNEIWKLLRVFNLDRLAHLRRMPNRHFAAPLKHRYDRTRRSAYPHRPTCHSLTEPHGGTLGDFFAHASSPPSCIGRLQLCRPTLVSGPAEWLASGPYWWEPSGRRLSAGHRANRRLGHTGLGSEMINAWILLRLLPRSFTAVSTLTAAFGAILLNRRSTARDREVDYNRELCREMFTSFMRDAYAALDAVRRIGEEDSHTKAREKVEQFRANALQNAWEANQIETAWETSI